MSPGRRKSMRRPGPNPVEEHGLGRWTAITTTFSSPKQSGLTHTAIFESFLAADASLLGFTSRTGAIEQAVDTGALHSGVGADFSVLNGRSLVEAKWGGSSVALSKGSASGVTSGISAPVESRSDVDLRVAREIADDTNAETRMYLQLWDSYRDAKLAREIPQQQRATQPHLASRTKWEGVVVSVGDETFVARLTDETGDQPEVEVELFKSEVSPADADLLRKRAVFYWVMGYRDTKDGDRVRESRLRFRRLPGWRPEDIERASEWADETRAELGWH
jgi:hypothetical protein